MFLPKKYTSYHNCIYRECQNTSVKTPEKLWIKLPNKVGRRNTWLKLSQRDPDSFTATTNLYLCEDHFDLENDMENYMQYKIMGSVKRIRMKPNCVPTRFGKRKLGPEIISTIHEGSTGLDICQSNMSHFDKFKRRLIRSVARFQNEKVEPADMWSTLNKETGKDCKTIWEHMRNMTLRKLSRLLAADDYVANVAPVARMTPTDWLHFDMVLVHEDIDVITLESGGKGQAGREAGALWVLLSVGTQALVAERRGTDLAEAWATITVHYNRSGRQCSPMLLQKRWHQLMQTTRDRFYVFWSEYRGTMSRLGMATPYSPNSLEVAIAKTFPDIITCYFPSWSEAIEEGRVIRLEELQRVMRNRQRLRPRNGEEEGPEIEIVEPRIETIEIGEESGDDHAPIDDNKTAEDVNEPPKIKEEPDEVISIDVEDIEPDNCLSHVKIVTTTHITTEDIIENDVRLLKSIEDEANNSGLNEQHDLETEGDISDVEMADLSTKNSELEPLSTNIDINTTSDATPTKLVEVNQFNSNSLKDDSQADITDCEIKNEVDSAVNNMLGILVPIPLVKAEETEESNSPMIEDLANPEVIAVSASNFNEKDKSSEEEVLLKTEPQVIDDDLTIHDNIPEDDLTTKECEQVDIEVNKSRHMYDVIDVNKNPEIPSDCEVMANYPSVSKDLETDSIIVHSEVKSVVHDNICDGDEAMDDDNDDDDYGEYLSVDTHFSVDDEFSESKANFIKTLDTKLIAQPIVYTTKLENMKSLRDTSLEEIDDLIVIEQVVSESKPEFKHIADEHVGQLNNDNNIRNEKYLVEKLKEDIGLELLEDAITQTDVSRQELLLNDKESVNANDNNDEPMEESEESSEDEYEDIRINPSSRLFKKPTNRDYNPVKLCKNPDFNTRLKRIPLLFYTYEENRDYLRGCMPVTIDLDKGFESRLHNNTIYLKRDPNAVRIKPIKKEISASEINEEFQQEPGVIVSQVSNLREVAELISDEIDIKNEVDMEDSQIDKSLSITLDTPLFQTNAETAEDLMATRKSKQINLHDICKVRRINENLLTAEISPLNLTRAPEEFPSIDITENDDDNTETNKDDTQCVAKGDSAGVPVFCTCNNLKKHTKCHLKKPKPWYLTCKQPVFFPKKSLTEDTSEETFEQKCRKIHKVYKDTYLTPDTINRMLQILEDDAKNNSHYNKFFEMRKRTGTGDVPAPVSIAKKAPKKRKTKGNTKSVLLSDEDSVADRGSNTKKIKDPALINEKRKQLQQSPMQIIDVTPDEQLNKSHEENTIDITSDENDEVENKPDDPSNTEQPGPSNTAQPDPSNTAHPLSILKTQEPKYSKPKKIKPIIVRKLPGQTKIINNTTAIPKLPDQTKNINNTTAIPKITTIQNENVPRKAITIEIQPNQKILPSGIQLRKRPYNPRYRGHIDAYNDRKNKTTLMPNVEQVPPKREPLNLENGHVKLNIKPAAIEKSLKFLSLFPLGGTFSIHNVILTTADLQCFETEEEIKAAPKAPLPDLQSKEIVPPFPVPHGLKFFLTTLGKVTSSFDTTDGANDPEILQLIPKYIEDIENILRTAQLPVMTAETLENLNVVVAPTDQVTETVTTENIASSEVTNFNTPDVVDLSTIDTQTVTGESVDESNLNESQTLPAPIVIDDTEITEENTSQISCDDESQETNILQITTNKDKDLENTNKKSILSDLMAMSGISSEDIVPSETVAPEIPPEPVPQTPYIKLKPELEIYNIANNPAINITPETKILTPVTSFEMLKYAHNKDGEFYKLDMESCVILPINVGIKRIKSYEPKPTFKPNPITVASTVDLTAQDDELVAVDGRYEDDRPSTRVLNRSQDQKQVTQIITPKLFVSSKQVDVPENSYVEEIVSSSDDDEPLAKKIQKKNNSTDVSSANEQSNGSGDNNGSVEEETLDDDFEDEDFILGC